MEEGLSQGTVNCIFQDADGFLWLGTQNGLNRHDGYEFHVYEHDPAEAASLPNSWILALAADPSGDLWIGTEGGGLARWRRSADAFVSFRHDPADPASLAGDRVQALHVDRRGTLWIGTYRSGLDRLAAGAGAAAFEHFRHDPAKPASLGQDRIQAIYEDRDGQLWIGTFGGGLDRFDSATGTFTHHRHDLQDPASLADDRVLSIVEDHRGTLWVGTLAGLHRRRPDGGFERFVHDPADPASLGQNRVRALYEDRDRRLWIGTDGGLDLLADAAGRFAHYRHAAADPASLASDRVMTLFQDRGGVLWVGTQGGGVNRWHPATWSFSHYRADPADPEGLASNAVFAFSEDAAGRIWVGTHGGLDVLDRVAGDRVAGDRVAGDRASGRFDHHRHDPRDPASLADDKVTALLHDRRETLWVGTLAGGLHRREPGARGFRRYRHDPADPASLSNDAVSSLFEDRRGTLWVGTFNGGLNRLAAAGAAGDASFVRYRHDPATADSLGSDRVTAFAEDAGGGLWIGTFSGLDLLDRESGRFRHFRHDPQRRASLSSDTVFALHADEAGALWIGTQSGLNKLERRGEEAAFRRWLRRDGLPDDVIYGIEADAAGRLWLGSGGGLARFDPASGAIKTYDVSHGLQSNEFNFGAHYRSRSGELLFGGVAGFNVFHPDKIRGNTAVPPVVLTSFSKLNQEVRLESPVFAADEISLGWRDYLVAFEVAALDYAAPEKNRYRYRLEGLDPDFIDLGHRRRVTFTNLAAGRYVLRLQGSNNDGVWNERGASIVLRVEPPPWQRWWAWSLYVLALGAAAWGLVQLHHAKVGRERAIARHERAQAAERERLIAELEGKNAELERFNYTVSHDLRTPLVTIKGFLGLLEKDAAAGAAERLKDDVVHIATAADRMSALLDELLEFSRIGRQARAPELVALGEIAGEAREIVAGLIAERGARVEIAPDLPAVMGDRLRLRSVFQNLLENAVKYMGDQAAPRVEVGARQEDPMAAPHETVVYVRDNGIGIAAPYLEKVFGLFERLDAGDEGTGVGLALARRIVEAHGGRIWVESEGPGRGSTFCFVLGRGGGPEPSENGSQEPVAEPLPAA